MAGVSSIAPCALQTQSTYQTYNKVTAVGMDSTSSSGRQLGTRYDAPERYISPNAQYSSSATPTTVRNLGGNISTNSVYVVPCRP